MKTTRERLWFDLFFSSAIPEWQKQAACRNLDPDLFFSPPGGSPRKEAVEACANCPVLDECWEFTSDWEMRQVVHPIGYAAGMGSTKRRQMYSLMRQGDSRVAA